jgi:putative ABC transport system permease protein
MKKSRIVKSGFRGMGRHKVRTFFMMLGIVVGIFALTVIFSIGQGTENQVMSEIEKLFSANDILISAGGTGMGGPRQAGPVTTFTIADLEAIAEEVPNVEMWDPMIMTAGREAVYKDRNATTSIWAHSPLAEIVWNRTVVSGEFFDDQDMESAARVALIGQDLVEELFGDADPLGEQVRIGNVPFRIKGVLELQGVDPHGMNRDHELWIPITTSMRRLLNVDYIRNAKLRVEDAGKMEENVTQITAILRERHSLAPQEPDDFHLFTAVRVREMVSGANRVFNLFLPLIAAISLVVGGVVVANLMLLSVNERIPEIGLRKAVGARSKDILLQFLMETTVVTFVGGVIGIVLGLVGVRAVTSMMGIPFTISWEAFFIAIVSSAVIGLLAGVFPARRAAAHQPVEALR